MTVPVSAPATPMAGTVTAVGIRLVGEFEREQLLSWLRGFANLDDASSVRIRRGSILVEFITIISKGRVRVARQWRHAPDGTPLPPAVAWHAAVAASKAAS